MNSQWKKFFAIKERSYTKVKELFDNLNLNINFKIIHVIGTNGKGSVSNHLAQGLQSSGYKVGLFTSPHLMSPVERIKVNDKPISEKEFFKLVKHSKGVNFFEKTYLVAMLYFLKSKVDIAVIEAGIGGKHDATKVVRGKVCVVTSIGLDHQDLLGSTTNEIARDKASIVTPNMHLYLPSTLKLEHQEIFKARTKKSFVVDNKSSNFVEQNKLLASQVLKKEFGIEFAQFKRPLGRVDIRTFNNQTYIFDVGHNFYAMQATYQYLVSKNIKVDNVVVALQKKKEKSGIVKFFSKYNLFYFKLNNDFHDFENATKIDENNLKNLLGTTLLIGSFLFISYCYRQWNLEK